MPDPRVVLVSGHVCTKSRDIKRSFVHRAISGWGVERDQSATVRGSRTTTAVSCGRRAA